MPTPPTSSLFVLGIPMLSGCLLLADPPTLIDDEPLDGWIDLAVTRSTVCGLQAEGSLWCGSPGDLRLEDGLFTALSRGRGLFGSNNICALRQDGSLACGVVGEYGDFPNFELPESYIGVSGDEDAGCGLLEVGGTQCWPENPEVSGPFTAIGAGNRFACGVRENSAALSCWSINNVIFDEALDDVPQGAYQQVATADHVGCAIATNGTVDCWGDDSSQDLLAGPPSGDYMQLSLDWSYACALTTMGSVECWGDAADDLSNTGLQPPEDLVFTKIDIDRSLGCGIDTESRLHCW